MEVDPSNFDLDRAHLGEPDTFQRFRVSGDGIALSAASLAPQRELLVFERGSERAALIRDQMVYHHVAQGSLGGHPFAISF